MSDFLSHYDAICQRLFNEKVRLADMQEGLKTCKTRERKTYENAIAFREREIKASEKELAAEIEFLKREYGIDLTPVSLDEIMSDDELLKELGI